MPKRFGNQGGASLSWPLNARRPVGIPSASGAEAKAKQYEGKIHGGHIRTRPFSFHDFNEAIETYSVTIPIIHDDDNGVYIDTEASDVTRGSIMVPRGGTLIGVQLIAEDALATNDTNYVTFTLVNNGPAGAGTAEMLSQTSDTHTTKATGGTAISAETGRSFTLSGTAANLVVAAGDVLTFTGTVSGTLANEVHATYVRLTFRTIPMSLVPRVTRTAGSPGIDYRTDVHGGWLRALLEATDEAQFAGYDFGDQRTFRADRQWEFEAYVSLAAALDAEEEFVCGVASDYNATLDSITRFAWFRITGAASTNLTLKIEADDGTVDKTTTTTKSLTAGTAALLRICSKVTGVVEYWLNDEKIGEQTGVTWDTTTLQPIFGIAKAGGTTVPSADIDYYYLDADRF